MIRAVAHLIDDASFGGINRMLDHMSSSRELQLSHEHRILRVKRGRLSAPQINADVIVSHLSINWANLPLLTALRAAYPDKPIIHVEHSYSQRFVAARVERKDRFDTLLRTAFALFDAVVAVSEAQHRWMERRQFCPESKLKVIPSCVDLEPFFGVAPKLSSDTVTIGAVGRFEMQKGFDILLEGFMAADRYDLELRFHGDGPQKQQLLALADGHARVAVHGYTPDTSAAIAACDAIAMPSRWEPYGLVALEAMAAGRAVLCPRVDGLSDHIQAGAIEIGENSVDAWKAFFLDLDPADLAVRGMKGRLEARDACARFTSSWTSLLKEVLEIETDLARAA